jgi:hypothetical protein
MCASKRIKSEVNKKKVKITEVGGESSSNPKSKDFIVDGLTIEGYFAHHFKCLYVKQFEACVNVMCNPSNFNTLGILNYLIFILKSIKL